MFRTRPGTLSFRLHRLGARSPTLSPSVCAFLGFALVFQVNFGLALLGDVWWWFPSWDNPATHAFEDAASFAAPYADPNHQARQYIVASATQLFGNLRASQAPTDVENLALTSRITRSPPAA